MNKDISATASQKTAKSGGTPFDEILSTENREKQRVQTEKEAMVQEESDLNQSLAKKEIDAEQKLKEEAKKELAEIRSKELSAVLRSAEKTAEKKCQKLEETYKSKAKPIAEKLAKKLIESDYSLSA